MLPKIIRSLGNSALWRADLIYLFFVEFGCFFKVVQHAKDLLSLFDFMLWDPRCGVLLLIFAAHTHGILVKVLIVVVQKHVL